MQEISTEGVCVRVWDWSETSQTASILTRDLGVVRVIAKGSKREKSDYSGGLEPATCGRLTARLKPGDGLSKGALLRALKDGRCFATEDKNLSVWFSANKNGQVFEMGRSISGKEGLDLPVTVRVKDSDEPNSRYDIQLYRIVVRKGIEHEKDTKPDILLIGHNVAEGQTWTATVTHDAGVSEAIFVHVHQLDGDGEDDAWSAPIYLDPRETQVAATLATTTAASTTTTSAIPPAKYLGSKNSDVYHLPGCSALLKVHADNLRMYTEAPPKKHLHECCPKPD